jgi:hypothetical protein
MFRGSTVVIDRRSVAWKGIPRSLVMFLCSAHSPPLTSIINISQTAMALLPALYTLPSVPGPLGSPAAGIYGT